MSEVNYKLNTTHARTITTDTKNMVITITSAFGTFSRTYQSTAKFQGMARLIYRMRFGMGNHFTFGADEWSPNKLTGEQLGLLFT